MIRRADVRVGYGRVSQALATIDRGDVLALAVLVALPLALYLPPTLAGHLLLPGDNATQNYPLRVLAGEIIASGKLPAWNSYIWSGTPLLAGWNAGAMFPGTWLFAFLPAAAAWTLNYLFVPIAAGVGMYLFLRRLGCRALAGLLGALVFSYTGFMSGQVVHLGLVQGSACLPWMLLGIDGVARAKSGRGARPYALVLATSVGLTILAADPRAISSAAIAAGVYLLACGLRRGARLPQLLGYGLAGATLGVGLAAVQWLPGISFLRSSQRSSSASAIFGTGSMRLGHLASLLLAPFMLGGNGEFGLPVYQGNYNLPELTIGVGLLALIAGLHYLPDLLSPLVHRLRHTRPRQPFGAKRPLGVWYVLALLGVLLSLGTNTALGYLLVHVPLYSGERLQNRNAFLLDLALAVLVGFYVEDHAHAVQVARAGGSPPPLSSRTRRSLSAIVPLATLGLLTTAFVSPVPLERALKVAQPSAALLWQYRGYLFASVAFACVVLAFVLVKHRLPARVSLCILAVLVVCDVATYLAEGDYGTVPEQALASSNPLEAKIAALTGGDGRFAIYNPAQQTNGSRGETALLRAGVSDLNVLHHNQSVQGYGSIVNSIYQEVTATHLYENLNVRRLDGVSFNTLDLRALATLPDYFGIARAPQQAVSVGSDEALEANGAIDRPAQPPLAPPYASGPQRVSSHASARYVLGLPRVLRQVEVVLDPLASRLPSAVSITLIDAHGRARTVVVQARSRVIKLPVSETASITFLVIGLAPTSAPGEQARVGTVIVTDRAGTSFVLDGALQGMLSSPHWRYAGLVGPLIVYANTETAGYAWLQPLADPTPNVAHRAPGSVRVISSPIAAQQMVVHAPRNVLLARSEGYAPGWSAKVRVQGRVVMTLPVHRYGLIQAVDLPAGDYVLTWTYAPRGLIIGVVITFAATFLLLLSAFLVFIERRGRARTRDGTPLGQPVA